MSGGEREEEEEEEKMSRKFKAGVYIVPYNVIFFPIHIVIFLSDSYKAKGRGYCFPFSFFNVMIDLNAALI